MDTQAFELLMAKLEQIDSKLDAHAKRTSTLEKDVALLSERQSTLSFQFKTVLGAIGSAMLACVGLVVKFWNT